MLLRDAFRILLKDRKFYLFLTFVVACLLNICCTNQEIISVGTSGKLYPTSNFLYKLFPKLSKNYPPFLQPIKVTTGVGVDKLIVKFPSTAPFFLKVRIYDSNFDEKKCIDIKKGTEIILPNSDTAFLIAPELQSKSNKPIGDFNFSLSYKKKSYTYAFKEIKPSSVYTYNKMIKVENMPKSPHFIIRSLQNTSDTTFDIDYMYDCSFRYADNTDLNAYILNQSGLHVIDNDSIKTRKVNLDDFKPKTRNIEGTIFYKKEDTPTLPKLMLEYYYAMMIHDLNGTGVKITHNPKFKCYADNNVSPLMNGCDPVIRIDMTYDGLNGDRGSHHENLIKISPGAYLSTLAHEFGHALKFDHPNKMPNLCYYDLRAPKMANKPYLMNEIVEIRKSYTVRNIFRIHQGSIGLSCSETNTTGCPCFKLSLIDFFPSYEL